MGQRAVDLRARQFPAARHLLGFEGGRALARAVPARRDAPGGRAGGQRLPGPDRRRVEPAPAAAQGRAGGARRRDRQGAAGRRSRTSIPATWRRNGSPAGATIPRRWSGSCRHETGTSSRSSPRERSASSTSPRPCRPSFRTSRCRRRWARRGRSASRRCRATTSAARPGTGTTSPAASTPARTSTRRSTGSRARTCRTTPVDTHSAGELHRPGLRASIARKESAKDADFLLTKKFIKSGRRSTAASRRVPGC